MSVVLATLSDISSVMDLINACSTDMEAQGIFQWNEFYPTVSIIEEDLKKQSLYIIKDEAGTIGMIVINDEQSPGYQTIDWKIKTGKVMVIHRLAVHPRRQREGIGRQLMDFAESYARQNGYVVIRLDAYTGNPRALNLYERRGYHNVGQLFFPWRDLPFNCYEKAVISY